MKAITVNGTNYKSIAEAWREESPEHLKEITVRLRLRAGWDPTNAFLTPVVPPEDRRSYRQVRES